MSDSDESKIEELKKRLYSPNLGKPIIDSVRGARLESDDRPPEVNQWGEGSPLPEHTEEVYHPKATRFFKWLFICSIAFCVIAAGVAVFMFFSNSNLISPGNIDISVLAPASIAGGEDLSLDVSLQNKNHVDLNMTHVRIDYPDGTYASDDTSKLLPRDDHFLDTVKANGQAETKFDAILFGEENVTKNFTITVQYQIPGSNTLYTKQKQYSVILTKAPISLLIDYDKTVTSGEDIAFTLTAISNSATDLKGLVLKAAYPIGFTYGGADMDPVKNTTDTWALGDFVAGQQKKITIHGTIAGQDSDQRIFRFSIGSPQQDNQQTLATVFVESLATMTLQKPFISTNLTLGKDNKDGDTVANLGDSIIGSLDIHNNIGTDIVDVHVQIMPVGQFFDRYTVKTSDGYYKSAENSLYWDQTIKSDLKTIAPGGGTTVNFSFNTFTPDQIAKIVRNPEMAVNVVVTGTTITNDQGTKDIKVSFSKNVKFTTLASLAAHTFYGRGAFKNTGPIPPRAEQTTTYTEEFDIRNTFNQVSNTVLTATLPFYVQWVPVATSSANPNITFDPHTRMVTWNVGELPAFSGYGAAPTQVGSFQVSIAPSVSQIDSVPPIVTNISVTGVDRFTGNVIQLSAPDLTTKLVDENLSGVIQK